MTQRNRENNILRLEAKQATKAFEDEANRDNEDKYEDFCQSITQDRTLHKFWQFYDAMNDTRKKAAYRIPEGRMRFGSEPQMKRKKTFLERFLLK